MEKERRINWLGLFIKIIIIFIFILIIVWLVSKILGKTRLSDTFKNNISNMETVATNYYKSVDLPLEKDKSLKISLGEMIEKGLIVSADSKNGTSCDTKKSFSKITRKKSNYILSTTLKCGKESNTITKKFPFKDCKNCNNSQKQVENKTTEKENKETKTNNNQKTDNNENKTNNTTTNTTNTTNNNNNQEAKGIAYYEYVKETVTYTKWNKGNVTGENIENRYEYYGITKDTYYSLGMIKESDFYTGNVITYTLKLKNVPNKNYYFAKIEDSAYYNYTEEDNYLKEKDIVLDSDNYTISNSIDAYSLAENNFTYKLSPYYRKGNFYIDVEITIINTNGVKAYNDKKYNIYYVPLKLNMQFASDNIIDSIPDGDYETITYYRYVEKTRDVIWSSENYVEGYTKTGRSEIR